MIKELLQLLKDLLKFDKEPDQALREILSTPLPKKSSRRLEDAEGRLQDAFRLVRLGYRRRFPGHTLVLTEVYRSLKKQKELYNQGRTKPGKIVTYIDGVNKKGKHNYYPSKAVDVAVRREADGHITWDLKYYKPLVEIVQSVSKEVGYKVVSGGSWKRLKDYPHIEV